MPTVPPTSVLFLWHQHQPFYKDPLSNRYEMPWVRLHSTKDYYDMVALLDEFPKIRLNFNLVPSLLLQLDDYGQGKAQEKALALSLKSAADLTFEDRLYLLHHFFMANWDTMIDPHPRYRELLDKRGRHTGGAELSRVQQYFKEQDWRDLQVWFNLAWFDPYWSERDPFIRGLHDKGKGFSEQEKATLIQKQIRICSEIVAKHKECQDRGQIEISASPFYHPILPLLCDTDAAPEAMPNVVLPQHRFAHPEDARMQIRLAIEDHQRRFGQAPRGMWPSEGSVSEAAIQAFLENQIRWIATDEAILAASCAPDRFERDHLYEPYRVARGDKSLAIYFRDHDLSDAIGFVYTTWDAADAVNDFMKRLRAIRMRLIEADGPDPKPHVISIILDGENCWEYYKQDGLPFLRGLYRALSDDADFETVLASAYLEAYPPRRELAKVFSGSWINANFGIWIGHKEDNLAWDFLYRTRQFLTHYLRANPGREDSPEVRLAWDEIYIAEGSDWCWWYGDDHSSTNDETFDYLFRKHLMNVYTVLGAKIPEDLRSVIKPQRSLAPPKPPVAFITPKIDGRVSSYFEWQGAGIYLPEGGATGTMHRAEPLIQAIYYGYDLHTLWFRIDIARSIFADSTTNYGFKVLFLSPDGFQATVRCQPNQPPTLTLNYVNAEGLNLTLALPEIAVQRIIEFGIPLTNFSAKNTFQCVILAEKDGAEIERWPPDSSLEMPYPTAEIFANNWVI